VGLMHFETIVDSPESETVRERITFSEECANASWAPLARLVSTSYVKTSADTCKH